MMPETIATIESTEQQQANPLAEVIGALDKLGLTADGQYYFDISELEPAGDILTLIRYRDECAISLYAKPMETGISLGGEQYRIIRNQTITQSPDGVVSITTGDAMILGDQPPLPIGMEITSSDDADDDFFTLLNYVTVLISCVRREDRLTPEQVHSRLNLPE